MKTLKVRLYIRVRLSDGRDSFRDSAWNRNRTLPEADAIVVGFLKHYSSACYYLRYLRGTRRVWEAVGIFADLAITALRNKEHELDGISLGTRPGATCRTSDLDVATVKPYLLISKKCADSDLRRRSWAESICSLCSTRDTPTNRLGR